MNSVLLTGLLLFVGCNDNQKDEISYERISATDFIERNDTLIATSEEIKVRITSSISGKRSVSFSGIKLETNGKFKIYAYADKENLSKGFEVTFTYSGTPTNPSALVSVKLLADKEKEEETSIKNYTASAKDFFDNGKLFGRLDFHNNINTNQSAVYLLKYNETTKTRVFGSESDASGTRFSRNSQHSYFGFSLENGSMDNTRLSFRVGNPIITDLS